MQNQPINDNFMFMTTLTMKHVAQLAVDLATLVLQRTPKTVDELHYRDPEQIAMLILGDFGDWRNIELPEEYRKEMERVYGEHEEEAE